jgi:hypothetical protein
VDTEEINPHLTAKIVVSYVRHHRLVPDQLADLISSVHRAIGQLGQSPEPDEVLTPAVSVRRSVHRDYVTCLDCGYRGKTLRRHISTRHGLRGRIPAAVGAAEQPSADGSRLLGAPLDHGEGVGLRSQARDTGSPSRDANSVIRPGRCRWEIPGETQREISHGIEVQGCCD